MRKLLALVTVFLLGCASFGQDFQLEDANKIKNGMTREEVISAMSGTPPYQLTNISFTYLYSRANGMSGSNSLRKFTVRFDEKGKVNNVPEGGYFGKNMKYLGERPL